jgi:hypothetical protein
MQGLIEECVLGPNDENPILAKLEYIGWVEIFLEFNYRVLKLVVLFCNWVKSIVMTFLVRECYGSPKKHKNSLKFVKIRVEECFDKVLNEEF